MNDGQTQNDLVKVPVQPAAVVGTPPQPVQGGAPSPAQSSAQPPAQTPVVMQSKMVGKYLVEVINDKCIGAASCVAIAPEVFQLNEENIAYVISQDGNDDDTKLLAAQSCPTAAIIVTDTTTGQQVWPRVDV